MCNVCVCACVCVCVMCNVCVLQSADTVKLLSVSQQTQEEVARTKQQLSFEVERVRQEADMKVSTWSWGQPGSAGGQPGVSRGSAGGQPGVSRGSAGVSRGQPGSAGVSRSAGGQPGVIHPFLHQTALILFTCQLLLLTSDPQINLHVCCTNAPPPDP